jgi:hypothetical protein
MDSSKQPEEGISERGQQSIEGKMEQAKSRTNLGRIEVRLHRGGKDKEGELIPLVKVTEERRRG